MYINYQYILCFEYLDFSSLVCIYSCFFLYSVFYLFDSFCVCANILQQHMNCLNRLLFLVLNSLFLKKHCSILLNVVGENNVFSQLRVKILKTVCSLCLFTRGTFRAGCACPVSICAFIVSSITARHQSNYRTGAGRYFKAVGET